LLVGSPQPLSIPEYMRWVILAKLDRKEEEKALAKAKKGAKRKHA